jgi:hypothetical protein
LATIAGIMPNEFYDLMPSEIFVCINAYSKRQEIEWNRTAWLAANIMNMYLRKPVTPDKLLGKNQKTKIVDINKAREEYQEIKRKFMSL